MQMRCQCQCLGIVAAGVGEYAADTLGLSQAGNGVAGSPEFERARLLEVLALEEDRGFDLLIESGTSQHWRVMNERRDTVAGFEYARFRKTCHSTFTRNTCCR